MNGVEYYGALLENASRVRAFERAIRATVRRGDRVLDLGTGLGTYALFAARAGAAEVWAVDRDPIVHVAESIALANGLDGAVRFVRGAVPGADVPSDFDVLVFEDFPVPLLDRHAYHVLRRVLSEHVRPGGRMVPAAARLSVAPLGANDLRALLFPGPLHGADDFGLDWEAFEPLLANTPRRFTAPAGWMLAPPVAGERLELAPPPAADRLTVEGRWEAGSGARIDALALWFDLEVSAGAWITNAPGPATEAWGQWLLPVHPSLDVQPGAEVTVAVRREVLDDGAPGWMSWEVSVGSERRRGHEFAGLAVDPAALGDAAARRSALTAHAVGGILSGEVRSASGDNVP